jgi:hypothetical protein
VIFIFKKSAFYAFQYWVCYQKKTFKFKMINIYFLNNDLLPFYHNFDPVCFHMENWDFLYSVTNFGIFYHFFHTLANFQLMILWKVGVFWQKLMTFRKIKIVLSFKCHVTFRLQTKRIIIRTFQASRIKIKNHNHVTSVSMVSQKSKRVLNKYVLLDKSFKRFCFALQSPFWLVASNDSFSLELT